MNELYSFCQVVKSLPEFKIQQDGIFKVFKRLGDSGQLDILNLLSCFKEDYPDLSVHLQRNFQTFCKLREETIKLKMKGYGFVSYGEKLYPSELYFMDDPPLNLAYLGSPAWLSKKMISVVGSREPLTDSLTWMEKEFSLFCEIIRPCVVSGGARGVDQKAHALAIRKSVPTIVVLPSGLEQIYPASLESWRNSIIDGGGCLISEYSFCQKMHKHLFYHRNRLIAALGCGTLLVEARRRSGTLITANKSAELGHPLWVIPGHPLDPHFSGSLELLSEGATLVRDAQDLIMYFNSETQEAEKRWAAIGSHWRASHYR